MSRFGNIMRNLAIAFGSVAVTALLAVAGWAQAPNPAGLPAAQDNPGGTPEALPLPPPLPENNYRAEGLTVVKIQDITKVLGYELNEVSKVGLVVGLFNTGGRSPNTTQVRNNLLNQAGIQPRQDNSRSTSIVAVQALIPPFARLGEEIVATVAVTDDATDLKGGMLLACPLEGFDGEVYAIASGPLVATGFSVTGAAGSAAKNHPTLATVRARIVKEICPRIDPNADEITVYLEGAKKDPVTAARIASSINAIYPRHAIATDPGSINVKVPEEFRTRQVDFVSVIQSLEVVPNLPARVVINQKTGTIVMGSNVKISKVMFANDNLIITMNENPEVSQPNPFGRGNTVVVPRTQITAVEQGGNFNVLNDGITVGELAQALNALGVTPQDLINILQGLRAQGSLHAELVEQ